jgi:anthranilate phosphoribosyltransferase
MKTITYEREKLQKLYTSNNEQEKQTIAQGLDPLETTFLNFLQKEVQTQPYQKKQLINLFEACTQKTTPQEIEIALKQLAPGNGHVGMNEIIILVEYLRQKIHRFTQENNFSTTDLLPHDHVFGSGGDFQKTIHASTYASILAAPLIPICKTGTTQVTAKHGSLNAIQALGYQPGELNLKHTNQQLKNAHFAFISLGSLGFPYSPQLRTARKTIWQEATSALQTEYKKREKTWKNVLKTTDVIMDIFKIISPNAQVLNPQHHTTGVPHLSMLPYVLGIYLHLNTTGCIIHAYSGIDELSTTSLEQGDEPTNLLLHLTPHTVTLFEFSPQDLGLKPIKNEDIAESDIITDTQQFLRLIQTGEPTPIKEFLTLNAAVLLLARQDSSTNIQIRLTEGMKEITQLINNQTAYKNYKQWCNLQ